MIGQTVSHYKILEKLGEGGMGVVYKAEDSKLDRIVALKFLPLDAVGKGEQRARFEREARAAAALNHPNICTIHEIDEHGGQPFIVMEFVEGETLAATVGKGPLKIDEALDIAIQAARGLGEAHGRGIVHRDIKPANIMVAPERTGQERQVKLMDFGLAQLVTARTQLTKEGSTLGTMAYMAPEQARGEKVDHRADIWALGVVLYEMVAGRQPYRADYEQAVLYSILNEAHEPLTAVRTGVPQELERIADKCLAKDSARRYQHTEELLADLRALREDSKSRARPSPPQAGNAAARPRARVAISIAALAAVAGASAGIALWLSRSSDPAAQPVLRQLTRDAGLTAWPALSPNGELLAYASDRGGDNLDIWVQQIGGGQPIRLTNDPADEYEPSFSPDGTRIAFRSDRQGGGVYVVSALGGDARRLADHGRGPAFSPDGKWLAYWVGDVHHVLCQLYVVASSGGSPRQIVPEFFIARYPAWSEDSRHLIFEGDWHRTTRPGISGNNPEGYRDVWVTDLEGGDPIASGAFEALENLGITEISFSFQRLAYQGSSVVLAGRLGDTQNLWRVPLSSRGWQIDGLPERMTSGAGMEVLPSAGSGARIVFSNLSTNNDIWSVPVNANRGEVQREPRRLTEGTSNETFGFLSADGAKMVYLSNRDGTPNLWLKDLRNGREINLTNSTADISRAAITADGTRVAYVAIEAGGDFRRRHVFVSTTDGDVPQEVLKSPDFAEVDHWSPDGTHFLVHGRGISIVHATTGERTPLVETPPSTGLFDSRFSPDRRWVAFHEINAPDRRHLFVAPVDTELPVPRSKWIEITDGQKLDGFSWWSPDGNLLYFVSDRDGARCVWARPLDPTTKQPAGDAFPVFHLHQRRRSLTPLAGSVKICVANDQLVLAIAETTGNIWMMEPSDGK